MAFDDGVNKSVSDRIYYSGANVKVYFGDVWVEELASIQYAIEENVAPVYGFNSYMFDKVARGTRLVTGSFVLNHTEAGYLDTILERISTNAEVKKSTAMNDELLGYLIDDVKANNSLQNIQNLLATHGKEKYENQIDGLKESFWGPQETSNTTMYRTGEGREYDSNYYANSEGSDEKNILKQHGFNILMDMSPSANVKDFEDCFNDSKKKGSVKQTFRSIMGVHITGENQMIVPNGQPLQTQYNFVARDIDGDVSQLSMKYNQLFRHEKKKNIPKVNRPKEDIRQNTSSGHDITMLPD